MASVLQKIYNRAENLYRQVARNTNLTNEKYLPYFDGHDSWPLEWHKAISESPSATSCLSTIQDFLEGFGFSDPLLEKKIVNAKGETLFQVHQKTVKDFAEFEGFAWLLRFNAVGQVTSWEVLPFENCRLGKPDSNGFIAKIVYNPFFGTSEYKSYSKTDTLTFDAYNPAGLRAQLIEQGEKFKGQVFYFGTTTALSRFYPMPESNSAIKWMKAEKGVADYHEDNINNAFLQPFMLIMKGDPNAPANNPDDGSEVITNADAFDRVISENFMGAKRVGNMFVFWTNNPDEKPEVLPMPSNNSGDQFMALSKESTQKITIAFKVPAILANINEGVSLGGDGNTVRVAVKLMQQRVIKKQRMLTDAYELILKNFDVPYNQAVTIAPYNPYPELEVVDDKIWNALTTEEQRDWIEKHTEIELQLDPVEPMPQPSRMTNAVPVKFPESVIKTIKKALDFQEKTGLNCGGKGGKQVALDILEGKHLGLKNLKRIHSYLKKRAHLSNSLYNEGCHVIEYNAWGGKPMEDFLTDELNRVDQWLN